MSICHILELVIQQAKHIFSAPYYIDSRGLSDSTIFSHIISQPAPFLDKKCRHWTANVCFDFLYNFCL